LAGNKETVSRAIEKAERFRTELVKRGVLLIPCIWGDYRKAPIERKGFGVPAKAAASLPSIGVRFVTFFYVNAGSRTLFSIKFLDKLCKFHECLLTCVAVLLQVT